MVDEKDAGVLYHSPSQRIHHNNVFNSSNASAYRRNETSL